MKIVPNSRSGLRKIRLMIRVKDQSVRGELTRGAVYQTP